MEIITGCTTKTIRMIEMALLLAGLISSELAPRYNQNFDRQALSNVSMVEPKVGFPYFSIFTLLFIRATWDNETLMVD